MGKLSCFILLFLVLFMVESSICCFANDVNASFGCFSREKEALLKFRASLLDPSLKLSTWNRRNEDCCTWHGVGCDNITWHVIMLDLANIINRNKTLYYKNKLHGTRLDSSLLELKHLSYLDLSGNDFQWSSIPSFLGSMKQLQHLNLSYTNFTGVVPHHLGNLSTLRVLDLSNYGLVVDDFSWVSRLSSLEHLDMSGVDLSPTNDLLMALNMLPALVVLSMSSSELSNTNLQHACVNSTVNNIQRLDLSFNNFDGEFPCFLHNMTSLTDINLSYNKYKSIGHHFPKLRNLVQLNLHWNSLLDGVDWISELIGDNCHLKSLVLNDNHLYGKISNLFQNSSKCWYNEMERLDLSYNDYYGHLPEELSALNRLTYLDVRSNKLSGKIPISFGNLSNLEFLDLSNNSFVDTISEAHFANMSNLEYLSISSNKFKFVVRFDWMPPFQLKHLWMRSCDIGGRFPQWLLTQKELIRLDLRNTSISGILSKQLHYINLTELYLDQNHIMGPIPNNIGRMMPSLQYLNMSENFINGSIPDSLCEMKFLLVLDLTSNSLSSNLPDCWANLRELQTLALSSNEISGVIPNSIGGAYSLLWLALRNNSFTGKLPSALRNCTELEVVDIGDNKFSGKLPKWIGKHLPNLRILRLRNNSFTGKLPSAMMICTDLELLDIGDNKFSGKLPKWIWKHLPNLTILSLRNNSFTGKLPSAMMNCTELAFVDIGDNKFSGKLPKWIGKRLLNLRTLRLRNNEFYGAIPFEFCKLLQLRILDLGNNNLTGNIPHCFGNFSGMVEKFSNQTSYGGYYGSLIMVLKGLEREYSTRFLFDLDLSNNNLVGEIPSELTRLSALRGLNLSHNHLDGEIPGTIGDLKSMESLDLSNNHLFGRIPDSLSTLDSMGYLNLSNNNLSGQIPTGRHLQTLDDPSIYAGNPGLCGAPLPKKCDVHEVPSSENHVEADHEEDDKIEKIWLYAFVACGYITGFWAVIGVLVFKRRWSQAFSEFVETKIGRLFGL